MLAQEDSRRSRLLVRFVLNVIQGASMNFLGSVWNKTKDAVGDIGHDSSSVAKDAVNVSKDGVKKAESLVGFGGNSSSQQQADEAQKQQQEQYNQELEQYYQENDQQQANQQHQQRSRPKVTGAHPRQGQNIPPVNHNIPRKNSPGKHGETMPSIPHYESAPLDTSHYDIDHSHHLTSSAADHCEQMTREHSQRAQNIQSQLPKMVEAYKRGEIGSSNLRQSAEQVMVEKGLSDHYRIARLYQKAAYYEEMAARELASAQAARNSFYGQPTGTTMQRPTAPVDPRTYSHRREAARLADDLQENPSLANDYNYALRLGRSKKSTEPLNDFMCVHGYSSTPKELALMGRRKAQGQPLLYDHERLPPTTAPTVRPAQSPVPTTNGKSGNPTHVSGLGHVGSEVLKLAEEISPVVAKILLNKIIP
jgi:hypothetical protein